MSSFNKLLKKDQHYLVLMVQLAGFNVLDSQVPSAVAELDATIAAKIDWLKLTVKIGSFIALVKDNTNDAKIMGIDKSIEKIAALYRLNFKKRAAVIVTPALLAPGIKAKI